MVIKNVTHSMNTQDNHNYSNFSICSYAYKFSGKKIESDNEIALDEKFLNIMDLNNNCYCQI
jgi:hypothetical protein